MKKVLSIILVLVILLSLCACCKCNSQATDPIDEHSQIYSSGPTDHTEEATDSTAESTQPEETQASTEEPTTPPTEETESIRQEQTESTESTVDLSDDGPYADILPEYRGAYALNNDLVGWIKIEGTAIDYPVMQTPDNKDYYLKHNFNKERSNWGCIYVRESCDVFTPSDNVTIYGHYMQDGSMFHDLHGYYYSAFYKEHPYIQFDTIYERHTYQIIAVFKTSANIGEGFSYHLFDYAADKAEFDEYINTVQSLRLYWTGVKAEYGDMLITLSTCEYTLDNGRLVVVAKRIS